jgi:hypothetical protein
MSRGGEIRERSRAWSDGPDHDLTNFLCSGFCSFWGWSERVVGGGGGEAVSAGHGQEAWTRVNIPMIAKRPHAI